MAYVHSKDTELDIATTDVSEFCDSSQLERTADVHQTTTYGKDDHTHQGGVRGQTFTCGGFYDNAASGTPRVLLAGNEGDSFAIERRPEGTGTGKPAENFNAILAKYTETAPVADMVKWQADFTVTGGIVDSDQA